MNFYIYFCFITLNINSKNFLFKIRIFLVQLFFESVLFRKLMEKNKKILLFKEKFLFGPLFYFPGNLIFLFRFDRFSLFFSNFFKKIFHFKVSNFLKQN